MKSLLLFVVSLIGLNVFSYESVPIRPEYYIVSDVFDSSLSVNTCFVFGKCVNHTGVYPLANSTVATLNRSAEDVTDVNGEYSITVSAEDSAIFFYHPEYGEIVIWNYDFKSQHRVEINFSPPMKHVETQNVKKPVIYLYADVETNVELTLTHPNITFTYPTYNENWSVKTLANGTIQDLSSQKKYPYLFWEGETENLRYQTENKIVKGQLVRTDTLVNYFETALTDLGLNEKEQTDFITFWAPSMLEKDFVFIQFLVDAEYDELVAGLSVTPTPDSRKRVFMQFTLLENNFVPFEYSAQEFPVFNRSGFTLIEWGGSEINFLTEVN